MGTYKECACDGAKEHSMNRIEVEMFVEELSHRQKDSLVTCRAKNDVYRRDSVLWLSALGEQVTELRVGQRVRVTVEAE